MTPEALVELAIFLAAQTGALIYFAASIKTEVTELKRRATETEATVKTLSSVSAWVKGKEGIQL